MTAAGPAAGQPSFPLLVRLVADRWRLAPCDLLGRDRSRRTARARMVLMWLAYRWTRLSKPRIGQRLGGRDHTTVVHGYRMIDTGACPEAASARALEARLKREGWQPHRACSSPQGRAA